MFPFDPYQEPQPSFQHPVTPPDVDPDEPPFVTVRFNPAWTAALLAACTQLLQLSTWDTDNLDDAYLAQNRAMMLLNALSGATSSGLWVGAATPLITYDPDTDTVQTSTDGGATWTPAPDLDPRNQNIAAPMTGDDVECRAASSVVRWLNDYFDNVLDMVEAASEAGGVIALMLELMGALGPFGLFLDGITLLADGIIGLGAEVVDAALSTEAYDQLRCIIYANMDSDGRLDDASFAAAMAQIDSDMGDVASFVLNGQLGYMGFGGVNTAAALDLDDTRDCTYCEEWSHSFDFSIDEQGWYAVQNPYVDGGSPCEDGSIGYYETAFAWRPVTTAHGSGTSTCQVHIAIDLPSARTLTSIDLTTYGLPPHDAVFKDDLCTEAVQLDQVSNPQAIDIDDQSFSTVIVGVKNVNTGTGIFAITLHGLGSDPFA